MLLLFSSETQDLIAGSECNDDHSSNTSIIYRATLQSLSVISTPFDQQFYWMGSYTASLDHTEDGTGFNLGLVNGADWIFKSLDLDDGNCPLRKNRLLLSFNMKSTCKQNMLPPPPPPPPPF